MSGAVWTGIARRHFSSFAYLITLPASRAHSAPDPTMGQRMINARSETLLEKPSFKQAIEKGAALKLNPYQNFSFYRPAATHKSHSSEPTKAQIAYQLKATVTPIPPSVGTIGKMISELGFSLSRCRWNRSSVVPTPTRAEPRISEAQ